MKTIVMIVALATAYIACEKIEASGINYIGSGILYYWFNTNGNYLRQNSLLFESQRTGYDNNPNNPKTLMENGYTPANCSITDSFIVIPIAPESPDQRLYSHP